MFRPNWHAGTFVRGIDLFGKDVASFNIKGQKKINTIVGGVVSLVFMTLIFMYGIAKFAHMSNKHNPNFSEYVMSEFYSAEDYELHLHNETNVRIAIGAFDSEAMEAKNDPQYVRWIARIREKDGKDINTQSAWLLDKCTEEDLEGFYDFDPKSKHDKEALLDDDLKSLHCLNWTQEMILKVDGLQNLEFMFVPCESAAAYLGEFYDAENFEACADSEDTQNPPGYVTSADALHQ